MYKTIIIIIHSWRKQDRHQWYWKIKKEIVKNTQCKATVDYREIQRKNFID